MRFVDEYRDGAAIAALAARIAARATRPWTLMEVCGGQTHAIVRHGLDALLPAGLTLVHGPGCPVCVTPLAVLDQAHALAARADVTFCTFADMLRVPGSTTDLYTVKARGGDVRLVNSPLEAVALAAAQPDREVVLFAIGFETTAPANAMAVAQAAARGLTNFSLLCAQVRVPPAMTRLLEAPDNRVQGFLAAGHVCAVMGRAEYDAIAARYHVPIVITGFEPLDILDGIARCIEQLEDGRAMVENAYPRVVADDGNAHARRLMEEIFEVRAQTWRGLGDIAASGLALKPAYARFDAVRRFGVAAGAAAEPGECRSGDVLAGRLAPTRCPAFGTRCTPEHPLGATMVSGEGACAAYYRYRAAATT
ncbi:MAG: hydrogenase formation protein HypD [Gammaproteobacteria bacterium]|nr:hydrogenase formation protein HypD [Gammaproteobacteria bacterium]MCP5198947.1 hydrogenase formation protein HypD [Gammaproteobacteria bacterium]